MSPQETSSLTVEGAGPVADDAGAVAEASVFAADEVIDVLTSVLTTQRGALQALKIGYETQILGAGAVRDAYDLVQGLFSGGNILNAAGNAFVAKAIADLAAETVGNLLDEVNGYSSGVIDKAASSGPMGRAMALIDDLINGGEEVYMAILQVQGDRFTADIDTQLDRVNDLLQGLTDLDAWADKLMDSVGLAEYMRQKLESAARDLKQAEDRLRRVAQRLETSSVFDMATYETGLGYVDEAEEELATGGSDDRVEMASGRRQEVSVLGDDLLDSLELYRDMLKKSKDLARTHRTLIRRRHAMLQLENRLQAAYRINAPWAREINTFVQRIRTIREDMEEGIGDNNRLKLMTLSPLFLIKIGLARGVLENTLRASVIDRLKSSNEAAITAASFRTLVEELTAISIAPEIDDITERGRATITAFIGFLTGQEPPEIAREGIAQYRNELLTLRSQYSTIRGKLVHFTGYAHPLVDEFLERVDRASPLFDGWGMLFDMLRLDLLAGDAASLASSAGLASYMVRSLNVDKIPALKSVLDRLLGYVDDLKDQQQAELETEEASGARLSDGLDATRRQVVDMIDTLSEAIDTLPELSAYAKQREGKLTAAERMTTRQMSLLREVPGVP